MRRALVGVMVLVATLTGCSSAAKPSSPPPTTSTPAIGPAAFYFAAHRLSLGTTYLANASDSQLLHLGNQVCDGLDEFTYAKVSEAFLDADSKPTQAEVDAFFRLAVTDLCPQQVPKLP